MAVNQTELHERTLSHYRDKFDRHGATPLGVDWNGPESQRIQFEQLLKLLPEGEFSINDLGCGYGGLIDVLRDRWHGVRYYGYDINPAMIEAGRARYSGTANVEFFNADRPLHTADYGIASGVFTLKLGRSDAQCLTDMAASLDQLAATSRRGFAFNALTSYSDPDRMKEYLYYPDPCVLFDLCKRRYSKQVALLHDYGLYACTLLIRRIDKADT